MSSEARRPDRDHAIRDAAAMFDVAPPPDLGVLSRCPRDPLERQVEIADEPFAWVEEREPMASTCSVDQDELRGFCSQRSVVEQPAPAGHQSSAIPIESGCPSYRASARRENSRRESK